MIRSGKIKMENSIMQIVQSYQQEQKINKEKFIEECKKTEEMLAKLASISDPAENLRLIKLIEDMNAEYFENHYSQNLPLDTILEQLINENIKGAKLLHIIKVDFNGDAKLFMKTIIKHWVSI